MDTDERPWILAVRMALTTTSGARIRIGSGRLCVPRFANSVTVGGSDDSTAASNSDSGMLATRRAVRR